jgi:hypothetical protein
MPLWLQHLLAFVLVGLCVAYIGWQAFAALRGRRSKLGSCCAKGCSTTTNTAESKQTREQFIPVDLLKSRRAGKRA